MSKSEELIKISSTAFLDLLLHVFRFWSKNLTGERKIVYGLLVGNIEENTRYVKKIKPILHQDSRNLEMDAKFMKQVGRINRQEQENNQINEVIGWYRSSNDGIKFAARDIKNHITFQEAHPQFIGLILDPAIYLDPDEFGFSVFRLEGDKYYNMMTDYYKLPWEIEEIEEPQEIISAFKTYVKNYFLDKPLINEVNE
jgi:hypothetical protein